MEPERWRQVDQLFQEALERAPEERAAFINEACGGDDSLRREVEELLAFDGEAGDFIEAPAYQLAAPLIAEDDSRSLAGESIGHYRIISLLGKGGMGEVYAATDTLLGRKVAVKLLPAEFTRDASRVRRFKHEARAASALNHPNIITIYEIVEAQAEAGGTHYIVTEYVEGETLRQRMAAAPERRMSLAEALDVAPQIAAALAAAHEAGIVHRDIKPENVMARRDGIIKVLDFGLAKLTEPPSPAVDTQALTAPGGSTESGVVMGTPRYMSPEQARGEKVDARTDIFSLGAMLYEMVAGRAPFVGATTSELIASILRDSPPPLSSHAPDIPPELERIVGKALLKNREERYQTAADLLSELKELRRDLEFAAVRYGERERPGASNSDALREAQVTHAPRTAPAYRRLAAIVALAGLALAAIAAWFYFNRTPVLTSKDTILLADFENKTGEEIFDKMLKQALAIQLQQSPFLNFFPDARMRQTLRLMGLSPDESVTAKIAREICERENIKAMIAGSIARLGSHYVITLEAVNGQTGESLAREQAEAEGKEQVLRALSKAAAGLRGKLGESLSSIQRFNRPLEEATTPKLEAFKAYSLGVEQAISGRLMEAIPLMKRAVEIDPDFAFAYSLLSNMHSRIDRPGLAAKYAEKGYAFKDRVSEYEKLRVVSFYHGFATGDINKRIETLTLLKRTYPREWAAPNDLAQCYNRIGQFDQAIAEARESIRLNPIFFAPHWNLGLALLRLNRFAEARDALAQALQQKLDTPEFHSILYQIAFVSGDSAEMQEQLNWANERLNDYVAFDWRTGAAAFAGQWRRTRELSGRAIDLAARGDAQEVAALYATEQALRGAVFGNCRQAGMDTARGLEIARGRASLPRAALALALCGETNRAKPLIDELIKLYPEDTHINSIWVPGIRATMELQRGNAAKAIEQLQSASRYEAAAEFWPQHLRGQAYLKLGRGAEAAAEFQKTLDHRGYAPLSPLYPLAHLGLARAAMISGDTTKARQAYESFLALWKDADTDLSALIEAKRDFEKLR